MSPDHQYYLVTGDPLLSLLQKYEEEVELSTKLYNELVEEFDFMGQAIGTWGDFDGTVALQFDYGKQPEGWVRYSVRGERGFWKPSSKTAEGKALIERLRKIRSEGTRLLQFIVSGNASRWMFMLRDLRGMVLGYEKVGTAFVFCYPVPPNGTKWATSGADRWQMPEEGVKLLSKGDYYQLLADHERTKA